MAAAETSETGTLFDPNAASPSGAGSEAAERSPAESHEASGQGSGPDPEARLRELEAERERWERERREYEARLEERNRSLDALLQSAPARSDTTEAAPQDPGPMPDPATDLDGFREWQQKREAYLAHRLDSRLRETTESLTENQRRQELWHEFQREHPDAARDPKLVAAAFHVETNGTGQLPSDTEDLKRRVADRILGAAAGAGSGEGARRGAGRTAGVSEGSAGGRTPPAGGAPKKPEREPGITDHLAKIQEDSPFF